MVQSRKHCRTVTINDVGEFLINFLEYGNTVTTDPIMTATQPAGAPGSDFAFYPGNSYHANTNQMGVSGKLKVRVPPVNINITNNNATAGSASAEMRISTGAYSVM